MLNKHVIVLTIIPIILVSLSDSSAGWRWDNAPSKGPWQFGGSLASNLSFDAAFKAVREGRDDEALRLIREVSASLPRWHPILLELARLQFAANQPSRGHRTLEQAALEYPTEPRVYLMFASLALGEERYSDARLNGEKALKLIEGAKLDLETSRATRREALIGLATAAEALEDWVSARVHLSAWLDLEPANAPARQRLGRALFSIGRTDKAYEELVKSAKDDPKLGPAAVPMALLNVQTGNEAKAEEWFVYASRTEPKSAVVRIAFARWRLKQGRATEARSLLEQAAMQDPNSTEIEPLLGLVALQLRDFATAERIFETLHRVAPAEPGFVALLALALVEQGDAEKLSRGFHLAEDGVRMFPKALDVLASLARAHDRSGHPDDAERLLRAAIAGVGGKATPTIAYFLAQVMVEKGQTDDARTLLRQALATRVAFAYQTDARTLLASLGEKGSATIASPATTQFKIPTP